MKRHTLPNGLDIVCQTVAEAEFFYEDIFVKGVYSDHGLTLPEDAVVFDVGANIGMFSLYTHYHAVRPRVFSFEPCPPLFAILRQNVATHRTGAALINAGISDAPGSATFTFYPNSSGMSSFHGDAEDERAVLRGILDNQERAGVEGMADVLVHVDDLLDERLVSTTFDCRLRTLADVIEEHGVEQIDLLKVDVQKAEHHVLRGIGEAHWPKVRQMVCEVHDEDGRVATIVGELEGRGFDVLVDQDKMYLDTGIYNLYATR